jgi:hypothetical protein
MQSADYMGLLDLKTRLVGGGCVDVPALCEWTATTTSLFYDLMHETSHKLEGSITLYLHT